MRRKRRAHCRWRESRFRCCLVRWSLSDSRDFDADQGAEIMIAGLAFLLMLIPLISEREPAIGTNLRLLPGDVSQIERKI